MRHENQKAVIAYNPFGAIILAVPEGSYAWREVGEVGTDVHEHLFITEGMHEQWSAWPERPELAVWEGAIEVTDHGDDGMDVEWIGTFRRAEVRDLMEFGLLPADPQGDP